MDNSFFIGVNQTVKLKIEFNTCNGNNPTEKFEFGE